MFDYNILSKARNMPSILGGPVYQPILNKPFYGQPIFKKMKGGDINTLIRDAQRTAASTRFSGHTTGELAGSTLAFLAPIILPMLAKAGYEAVKKIKKKKTKKEPEDVYEIKSDKISPSSKSILDRVLMSGTGISIF